MGYTTNQTQEDVLNLLFSDSNKNKKAEDENLYQVNEEFIEIEKIQDGDHITEVSYPHNKKIIH